MHAALTLFCVYLANILPGIGIFFYYISSLFIMGILQENNFLAAIITFVAVFFVGMLIVPVKAGMLPYLFFFGHYGIFKYFVDEGTQGVMRMVVKLAYFFACNALIYFFDGGFMISQVPWTLPLWAYMAIFAGIFVLYDFLFGKLAGWYANKAKPKLLGGRL